MPTTQQVVPVSDDQNTLRVESRGPTLLEDFHFRGKIVHFDRERMSDGPLRPLTQLVLITYLRLKEIEQCPNRSGG